MKTQNNSVLNACVRGPTRFPWFLWNFFSLYLLLQEKIIGHYFLLPVVNTSILISPRSVEVRSLQSYLFHNASAKMFLNIIAIARTQTTRHLAKLNHGFCGILFLLSFVARENKRTLFSLGCCECFDLNFITIN